MTADRIPECYLPRLHYRGALARTKEPWVDPCKSCGGTDFDLRRHADGAHGLMRYCVPCQRANDARWRPRNSAEACSFPGCDRPRKSRYCVGHAKQYQRKGLAGMGPLAPWKGKRK